MIDPANVGVLRLKALPGELVLLYRSRGFRVSDAPSVVFLSEQSSRRATVFLLFEALIGGVIALVFAWILRRRIRRVERRLTTVENV